MSQNSNNPLFKHFRQPALYIKLTSNGRYWKEGTLDLPASSEIPVYPMTTRDEITLRTPDALLNGTSVVEVIQSCCPSIKNAWAMPSIDVDSTLIAIRIASYGPEMTLTSKCPKCSEEHDYSVNLPHVLAGVQLPNYEQVVTIDPTLKIKLRPMNYQQVSKSGSISFEEEKLISTLTDPDIDEEVRQVQYNSHIQKMIDLNIDNITYSTDYIDADGEQVSNPEFIKEYYKNAGSAVIRQVQDKLKEFAKAVDVKSVAVARTACSETFDLMIEFDYASFFGQGF